MKTETGDGGLSSIKLDLTRLKIGYECKNVFVNGKSSIENSTNVSVSLWWIYFVCSLVTTGQGSTSSKRYQLAEVRICII